ncbi:MAG: MjaI family restriction endonuclease [Planctomycetes bacterium]|nr:MjaI family restriction endonuclease [Planctomycetota bacterium]MBL7145736.1 MjaI family restriction endonuclease [Phycisphaerae bacterium]
MAKEWIKGREGRNLRFKRENLLNWATNRWNLNYAYSVGPTSELIRKCSPKIFEDWEIFYFENAYQKKKDGIKVTREHITQLGEKLYIKLSEVIQNELESIHHQECIDYVYNLVLNRTYEGYQKEIGTIYGQLESILDEKIQPAPDEWDRRYNVDFFIEVKGKYIGLQIKPISSGRPLDYYQWERIHEENHKKFKNKFGGQVFFIYSTGKKEIYNLEVINEIKKEVEKLNIL